MTFSRSDLVGGNALPPKKFNQNQDFLVARALANEVHGTEHGVLARNVSFETPYTDFDGTKRVPRAIRNGHPPEKPYVYRGTGQSDPKLDAQWRADGNS